MNWLIEHRDGVALAVAAAGSLPFLIIDIAAKVIG